MTAIAQILPAPGGSQTRTISSAGLVGVGNMGAGMARRLLAMGWTVHVCDIDAAKADALKQKGAFRHDTPKECAIDSEAIIVCVVDALQTEDVLFGAQGIAAGLPTGRAVMLCPTIAPQDVERFAARLASFGLHCIDAPMSGGPVRAAEGSMSLMVACDNAVFDAHQTLLNALSNQVFRISERPGDGARTKLVNNLLAGINLVGAAEVLAMAGRMGLNLHTTLDVIAQSSGQSWIGEDRMRRAVAGNFAPAAHMTLLQKDTRLAVAAGAAAGFSGPLGAHAATVFAQASADGHAHEDDSAVFKWLQRHPEYPQKP
ncbi:MAG: NAD(P)-dependent oxidoreductase [Betaproteobacteria bacterium]|jgi:putative dehydrogenase|nr:NAD(P)-dependent oxidoreductase [Betaproteobacteria bacterium]MBP6645265.1 NAD(P)-dependent oxidoreductase [Burkholderiaceae bacterium]